MRGDFMQSIVDPDETGRSVFAVSSHHPAGCTPWHTERFSQLIYPRRGGFTLQVKGGQQEKPWTISPRQAVWVPSGIQHAIRSFHSYRLLTCYIEPKLAPLFKIAAVVRVNPLIREMLMTLVTFHVQQVAE